MSKWSILVTVALLLVLGANANNGNGNGNGNGNNKDLAGYATEGGSGLLNWRAATQETKVDASNVGSLRQVWNHTLTDPTAAGGYGSIPVSTGDKFLYTTTYGGMLYAFDRTQGFIIWQYNISSFLHAQLPHGSVNIFGARASPTIDGDNLYVATLAGAFVIAFDRERGTKLWATQIDSHPFAEITASVRVYDEKIFVGVSSGSETQPDSECCDFRGSFVALHSRTGSIAWRFYTIPDNHGQKGSWSGGAVWSNLPPIDVARNQIIITTGNFYSIPPDMQECLDVRFNYTGLFPADPCRHPDDYTESIIALDLDTGLLRWTRSVTLTEVWTLTCTIAPESNPTLCQPANLGDDFDFGQGPVFIPAGSNTPDGEDALVVCQKSGVCYCLSAQAGTIHWALPYGVAGNNGGFEFGSATDGKVFYYADTNSDQADFVLQNGTVIHGLAHLGASDIKTGRILWEAVPNFPQPGKALFMQGVTYANGVVYGCSLSYGDHTGGHLYAVNAVNGKILADMKLDADSCYPPAVVDGIVYVACGYNSYDGLISPLNTLYAFAPHK